jgi:hypothetical protein
MQNGITHFHFGLAKPGSHISVAAAAISTVLAVILNQSGTT